jgi:glyoxylase-like metal-dependent hydrolase (beta-lactamase superfamily II)
MFEEILHNLYRIEIPLPNSPLKSLNSYLIKGDGRFLLVDTGMNRKECYDEMLSNLAKLGVDLKKTDFFITHLHVDHLGLVEKLATETSTVYFNRIEAAMVSKGSLKEEGWHQTDTIYLANGFPEDEFQISTDSHPRRRFGLTRHIDFTILKEADSINIGDYSFKCIETPGHSPGHMCLYEASKKILLAGDLILFDITPNITFWFNMENSLKSYLASLDRVYAIDVKLVLTGHRSIMSDHKKRIKELQEHHRNRLNEVILALMDGAKTAYQVTPYVTWDFKYKSWKLFPALQKWFALGETLAHLKYLEKEGIVKEGTQDGKIIFSL